MPRRGRTKEKMRGGECACVIPFPRSHRLCRLPLVPVPPSASVPLSRHPALASVSACACSGRLLPPEPVTAMRPKRAKDRLMLKAASSSTGTPAGLLRAAVRTCDTDGGAGSDEDSNMDNVSVYSFSSSRYDRDDILSPGAECDRNEAGGEDGDDGYYDDFEDKLVEAIESASEKSTKGRILALEAIARSFKTRFMFDFICDRFVCVCLMSQIVSSFLLMFALLLNVQLTFCNRFAQ